MTKIQNCSYCRWDGFDRPYAFWRYLSFIHMHVFWYLLPQVFLFFHSQILKQSLIYTSQCANRYFFFIGPWKKELYKFQCHSMMTWTPNLLILPYVYIRLCVLFCWNKRCEGALRGMLLLASYYVTRVQYSTVVLFTHVHSCNNLRVLLLYAFFLEVGLDLDLACIIRKKY